MIWRVFIKTTAILPGVWFCYIRGQFGFIIDLWRQYWVRVCTYHTRGVKFFPGVISSFMEGFVCCSTSHWGVKFFPVVIRSGMEGVFLSRMSLWSRQLYCAHHTPWCVKVHRCGHRRLEDYPVCIALYFQGVTILTGVSDWFCGFIRIKRFSHRVDDSVCWLQEFWGCLVGNCFSHVLFSCFLFVLIFNNLAILWLYMLDFLSPLSKTCDSLVSVLELLFWTLLVQQNLRPVWFEKSFLVFIFYFYI